MEMLRTIILGITQGFTEWLPVSSTGHLRVLEYFFKLQVPLLFDITLHLGTLAVTFVFFRNDIKNILVTLVKRDFKTEEGQLTLSLLVGVLPTVLIGFFFLGVIEFLFEDIIFVSVAFIICGIILYLSKNAPERKPSIKLKEAFLIGVAQSIAIIPGISRSGLTITTALLLGIQREKAFKFSFLVSIPTIIGAAILTFFEQRQQLAYSGVGIPEILIGVAISMFIGFFALKVVRKILLGKSFHLFSYYCWLIGLILVGLSLGGF